MIKTVIFDLGGVYFTNGTKRAVKIFSSKYSLEKTEVKNVLKGDLGSQYRIGSLTTEEFWTSAKKKWNLSVSSNELSSIWLEGYEPIEGMENIVNRLIDAGYELIYLSDNVQERVDYLNNRFHFIDKFKDGIFSFTAKIRKPDLKIYQMALEKSSNFAEESVYIDDVKEFLEPAMKLGMKTILFKNVNQLATDLKGLGLMF